jgi:hypothetical protein
MTDLEQHLRDTLHELADTVPPSANAKADFERRRTAHRGVRRPALVAAAAAVAVLAGAGVAIPLALDEPSPPAAEKKTDGLLWSRGYDWPHADSGPHVLGTFDQDGRTVDAVAWVQGGDLCVGAGRLVAVGGQNERPPGALVDVTCGAVPRWPSGPEHSTHVETRPVLPGDGLDSGPVPGLMLFLADPVVTDLEVQRGDGSGVSVRELDRIDGLALFLADFAGSTQGFGYTAYDGAGNVVEGAIT